MLALRRLARPSTGISLCRFYSGQPDPKEKAASLIESLPGNSIVSKTGILAAGTALATIAISNELYVVNEETVVLVSFAALAYGIARAGGPAYREWADGHIQRIKDVLVTARAKHSEAVQSQISKVGNMKNVVEITKQLFQVSKETAELEARAFELEQKVNFSNQAKAVLDSWVRHESSVRQRQQQQLAETLMQNIQQQVRDPSFQKQALQQAIQDVERLVKQA